MSVSAITGSSIVKFLMLSLLSRRLVSRAAVRAFSATTVVSPRATAFATTSTVPTTDKVPSSTFSRRFLSSAREVAGDVDLDEALDSILEDAFDEAGDPRELDQEAHMKGSKPVPKALVEEVSL